MLFCPTLVRGLTGASVHHNVRQDRVERHDRDTIPAHGASDGQGRDVELSLLTSTGSAGPREGKKDPAILEDLISFPFSSLPSVVTPAFPWPIKEKAGCPIKGIEQIIAHRTLNPSTSEHV